jgi:hypothetical protein
VLPYILGSLTTVPSQHGFKQGHSTVTGQLHSPARFNHFISDIPLPIPNIASYADDLTISVSSPRLDAAEAEIAMLLRAVSDWSAEKNWAWLRASPRSRSSPQIRTNTIHHPDTIHLPQSATASSP